MGFSVLCQLFKNYGEKNPKRCVLPSGGMQREGQRSEGGTQTKHQGLMTSRIERVLERIERVLTCAMRIRI